MQSTIIIFTTEDENVELDVRLQDDTVWLNRQQMSALFDRDIKTIGKHINNIFAEGELEKLSTVANFATVQTEGKREVTREIEYYNLDAIISVGYRVKSQKGTQFRMWATKRLKDYLIEGYAINQQRLVENQQQFLQTLEDLKALTKGNQNLETQAILSLIQTFSDTWFTLESYDKQQFPQQGSIKEIQASADELLHDLQTLKTELMNKGEATALFAQEKITAQPTRYIVNP